MARRLVFAFEAIQRLAGLGPHTFAAPYPFDQIPQYGPDVARCC